MDSATEFVNSRADTFRSLLIGMAQERAEKAFGDLILMKIIKHPVGNDGHDITIAILMGYQGSLVDDSRWLILRDCATDYSGGGKKSYSMMRDALSRLEGRVEVETITIERADFMSYLEGKNILNLNNIDALKLNAQLEDNLTHARGKLFEFIVHKWVAAQNFDHTYGDLCIDGEQIDCYAKKADTVELFECKLNLHDDDEVIQQLRNKSVVLSKKYTNCKIVKNLIVFRNLTSIRREKMEENGIHVHHNFKSKIRTSRVFDGSRRELLLSLGPPYSN